jgi:hypothetical protein
VLLQLLLHPEEHRQVVPVHAQPACACSSEGPVAAAAATAACSSPSNGACCC